MHVRRLMSALIGAVILVPVFFVSPVPTTAHSTTPRLSKHTLEERTEPTPEDEVALPYEFVLSPTQPVVAVDDDLELRLLIRNNDEKDLSPGTVDIALLNESVTNTEQLLTQNLAENTDALLLTTVETPTVAAGSSYEINIDIPSEEHPLDRTFAPGVYFTTAVFTPTNDEEQDTEAPSVALAEPSLSPAVAPLVWRGNELASELSLSVIVPLLYPAGEHPPLTVEEVEPVFAQDGRLAQLLESAETTGATLAVDPKIISVVRALGDKATPTAREIVDRIVSGNTATFSLQYADADPGIQAALDLEEFFSPTDFSFITRHFVPLTEPQERPDPPDTPAEQNNIPHPVSDPFSTDQTQDTEDPQPDPSPDTDVESDDDTQVPPDPTAPPTRADLLEWEPTLQGFAWPVAGEVSAKTIAFLEKHGVESVVLSGTNTLGQHSGSLSSSTAYVSDQALERFSTDYLTATNEADRGHAASMLASLTALYGMNRSGQDPPTEAILALNRLVTSTAPEPERLLELINELPWVFPHELEADPQQTVSLREGASQEGRVESIVSAIERESKVVDYSRVLQEPKLLVDYQRDRLLTLMGAGLGEHPELFAEQADLYEEADQNLLRGISVVDTEHTRLLGASTRIPVQLRNTLPFDALIVGKISATSAALIVEEPTIEQLLIPASGSVTKTVPVVSRVSNGQSGLLVTLHDTHDGQRIASRTLEMTIQSETEVIALGALAAITVALLGFGTLRSIKRHQPVTPATTSPGE